MKKLIAIILSLVMLLSLVACAPNEVPTEPATDAPTEKPTEKPTEAPTDAPTNPPTDPAPTDPAPTDPPAAPTLQDSGYCAVGILDAEAGTAKILADNGAMAEISYTSEGEVVAGNVYAFVKEGDVYTLTLPTYMNEGPWGWRTLDGSGTDGVDQLYGNNGSYGFSYDLTEDFVAFMRFSETEWRIFRGSDAIKVADWPSYGQIAVTQTAEPGENDVNANYLLGTCHLYFIVGDVTQGKLHCDEVTSYHFDPEGYGWNDGDLIIE